MKIALTTLGKTLMDEFNPRFGRADFFIIYDTDTQADEAFANPAASASGGAGAQAVQFIANKGVEAVISGRYGPKAFAALEAAGIKAFIATQGSIVSVVEQYQAGELKQASAATGPELHGGH